ncbi:MAG: lipid-A-disaccharide synthase N-terminal domain-containing protein, partial [Waddliaceae bacterium]
MIDNLRHLLYYPLGLLPTIFFTSRLLVQWFQSEKYKQSYTSTIFWRLSLAGNLFLMLHYFVQVQFPFSLLQAGNAVISWRNLNLLNPRKRTTTSTTFAIFLSSSALLTLAFLAQSIFIIGELDWMRTPTKLFDAT